MSTLSTQQIKLVNNIPATENDFYFDLKKAKNIDDLNLRILKTLHRLGYSDYIFTPLEKSWEDKDENQQSLLSSYPEEYWRVFAEDQLYLDDMLISFFKENVHPIYTSQVYDYYCNSPFDTQLTRVNRAIRQLQHSFGFHESYVIPIITENGKFLFSISQQNMSAADLQARTNNLGAQLRLLGKSINKVCSTKFQTLFEPPKKEAVYIAPKPLKVLATLANADLSITEVASKLCISPITAHQHIAAARKALNRNTNIGAIKEAIDLGLITYD